MSDSVSSFVPRNARVATTEGSGSLNSTKRFSSGAVFSIDTKDFDEFRDHAKGWRIEHQLIGAKKAHHSALSGVITPLLQIAFVQHSMGYCSQGRNPEGALTISVPLDERPVKYRGEVLEPMQMPLIRSAQGYELLCASGARFLVVTVAESKAELYASEVAQKPLMWRTPADRLRFPDPSYRLRYINALTNLLSTIEACPTLLNARQTEALLEERLLECLPLEAHGDYPVAGDRGRYKVARLAYRFLQDRIDSVPSILDLCVVTGASYATLERGFREMYGTTPKTLIQGLKLSRARSALLRPAASTTVTEVALNAGFLEFGRFSLQYRERYGESPSVTLAKARGVSADS